MTSGVARDSEALAIMLANAFGGKDFTALANELLSQFPSMDAALDANYNVLMTVEGMTESVARYLVAASKVRGVLYNPPQTVLSSEELIASASRRFKSRDCECAELYIVTKSGKVTDYVFYNSALANKVTVNIQQALSRLTAGNGYGFYLVHNHVCCPSRPSADDDVFTRRLLYACKDCKIKFLDHCIVDNAGGSFSYAKSGRLDALRKTPNNNE